MPPITRTIAEILATPNANDQISALKNKPFNITAWAELRKEYDPKLHPVKTDPSYTDKTSRGKLERMTRVTYAIQKHAVKRMKELMFTIPVSRKYTTNNDQEKDAANIMEAIFKRNHIDALNIKRSHKLFASCEMITIWYTQEQPTQYAGRDCAVKLRCKTFSPMDGDALYPLFDEYDDMVALSVEYERYETATNTKTSYFDTYTADLHIRWAQRGSDWQEELREPVAIGKIQGIYIHRSEPIWEEQSENCFELEWTMSRNGNYLRKNSRPTFIIYSDKGKVTTGNPNQNDDNKGRSVLRFGAKDRVEYATWNQAVESLKFHTEELRRNIHTSLQLPDMSMEQMKATPMSGEARKMLFIDCQMKVTDESGDWLEFFDREVNVVREFCKQMFPSLAPAFDALVIENEITPYKINSLSDDINDATRATNGKAVASRRTMVRRLGLVPEEEVDAELEAIAEEETATDDLFSNEPME